MKQITILIKCPDQHVNSTISRLVDVSGHEILGIDVKEIGE